MNKWNYLFLEERLVVVYGKWNFKDKTFVAVNIRDSSVIDSVTIFMWKKKNENIYQLLK